MSLFNFQGLLTNYVCFLGFSVLRLIQYVYKFKTNNNPFIIHLGIAYA